MKEEFNEHYCGFVIGDVGEFTHLCDGENGFLRLKVITFIYLIKPIEEKSTRIIYRTMIVIINLVELETRTRNIGTLQEIKSSQFCANYRMNESTF